MHEPMLQKPFPHINITPVPGIDEHLDLITFKQYVGMEVGLKPRPIKKRKPKQTTKSGMRRAGVGVGVGGGVGGGRASKRRAAAADGDGANTPDVAAQVSRNHSFHDVLFFVQHDPPCVLIVGGRRTGGCR